MDMDNQVVEFPSQEIIDVEAVETQAEDILLIRDTKIYLADGVTFTHQVAAHEADGIKIIEDFINWFEKGEALTYRLQVGDSINIFKKDVIKYIISNVVTNAQLEEQARLAAMQAQQKQNN